MQVVKNDGTRTPFDAKKIIRSVTRAAQDAKLTPEEINKLVNDVSNTVIQYLESEAKIPTSVIREKILSELDIIEPRVSLEWRKFMNAKKR